MILISLGPFAVTVSHNLMKSCVNVQLSHELTAFIPHLHNEKHRNNVKVVWNAWNNIMLSYSVLNLKMTFIVPSISHPTSANITDQYTFIFLIRSWQNTTFGTVWGKIGFHLYSSCVCFLSTLMKKYKTWNLFLE